MTVLYVHDILRAPENLLKGLKRDLQHTDKVFEDHICY